nr:hypothetical protein [Tanacetum cinerariifolium]
GDFGGPVVHFGVDVHRVLAVPGALELVVPDALQVGRLPARLRRADEQIAPVLEIQSCQRGVVALRKTGNAFGGRELRGGRDT